MSNIIKNLECYKKLRNLFNAQMGPYRVGDIVFCDNAGTGVVINVNHPSLLKIKFQSRASFCDDEWFSRNLKFTRIPQTVDPLNPSRGLFGMLKKFFRLQYTRNQSTNKLNMTYQTEPYEGNTLEVVILKALMAQEDIQ